MKKIILLIFAFFIFPVATYAKSYSIKAADFFVQLNADGSADVEEKRTYDFSGSYSWADEWIPLAGSPNYKISNVEFSENGLPYQQDISGFANTYELSSSSDKLYIKWHYAASNEEKTFSLKYHIVNAVTEHPDTLEFYWKLIGDEWAVGVGQVNATVKLPASPAGGPSDKIYAFGHGPLNGKVTIVDTQTIKFTASDLPAKQFFEVRVLYPKENSDAIFPRQIKAPLSGVLSEEKGYGEETKSKVLLNFRMMIISSIVILVLCLLVLARVVFWIFQWWKIGRDEPLPQVNLAGKLHDPPSDLPPALVEALTHYNYKATGKSIVATILELVRRKIITIEKKNRGMVLGLFKKDPEYFISIKDKDRSSNNLSELEQKLVEFIFGSLWTVSLDEVKKYNRVRPVETQNFWQDWQKKVFEQLINDQILEETSNGMSKRVMGEGILMIVAGFLFFIFGIPAVIIVPLLPLMGIVLLISAIILFVISVYMQKRTHAGNEETAKWLAFKKFLDDYSVTKKYPLDSVILWEKYLVYGTALGISSKALSELPINFAAAATSTSGFYVYAYGMSGQATPINSADFASSFTNLSNSFSALSSAFSGYGAHGAGSSGGFSGGGSGGGGGGGGGAG